MQRADLNRRIRRKTSQITGGQLASGDLWKDFTGAEREFFRPGRASPCGTHPLPRFPHSQSEDDALLAQLFTRKVNNSLEQAGVFTIRDISHESVAGESDLF